MATATMPYPSRLRAGGWWWQRECVGAAASLVVGRWRRGCLSMHRRHRPMPIAWVDVFRMFCCQAIPLRLHRPLTSVVPLYPFLLSL